MEALQVKPGLRRMETALAPHVAQAEIVLKPHVNRLVLAIGMLYPLATMPQIYNVWVLHRTGGLSEVTYAAGLLMALLWTAWGLLHHERMVWSLNLLWVGVHATMIAGLLQ